MMAGHQIEEYKNENKKVVDEIKRISGIHVRKVEEVKGHGRNPS